MQWNDTCMSHSIVYLSRRAFQGCQQRGLAAVAGASGRPAAAAAAAGLPAARAPAAGAQPCTQALPGLRAQLCCVYDVCVVRLQYDVLVVSQSEPDEWEIAAEELLMGPRIGIGSFGEVSRDPLCERHHPCITTLSRLPGKAEKCSALLLPSRLCTGLAALDLQMLQDAAHQASCMHPTCCSVRHQEATNSCAGLPRVLAPHRRRSEAAAGAGRARVHGQGVVLLHVPGFALHT